MSEQTEPTAPHQDAAPILPAPRTRWAAIIWGAVFAAIALWALRVFGDVEGRIALAMWIGGLTPASAVGYLVLALGTLVLVLGLIAVLRRAQRRRETPPPSGPTGSA